MKISNKQKQSSCKHSPPVCINARRDPHVFAEGFHEIAAVIKTAAIGGLRHRKLRRGQDAAGLFDPVIVQIVHRRAVQGGFEKTAEVFGAHPGQTGEVS